jgi:hypothetical protein
MDADGLIVFLTGRWATVGTGRKRLLCKGRNQR